MWVLQVSLFIAKKVIKLNDNSKDPIQQKLFAEMQSSDWALEW